jgi:di/tricarboxylate transporter
VSPAVVSLAALLIAIVLSMISRINVGLVAIAFAWGAGAWAGQSPDAIMRGFPVSLFLTLTGVTLLFAMALANRTLEALAERAVRLARGSARALPLVFFGAAGLLSAVGPGAISSTALIAPLAMAIGGRAGVPAFLTALMVANGANAGNLSPVSAVGVIANTKIADAGLGVHHGKVFLANFVASLLVALAAYLLLGRRLSGRPVATKVARPAPLTGPQQLTSAVIVLWIAAVLLFKLPLGMSAIAAAVMLVACRAVDEAAALALVPWGVIVMVTGVTMLVALLEATGGKELFTAGLAKLATPATLNGVVAFVTGGISLYSSTSGVVLPAFLPMSPGLVSQVGGGDPLAVALSINVGSSLVDVSPLSTLGALCLAALPDAAGARPLFRQLLTWGVAMAFAGALLSQLLAGILARW